MELQSGAKIQDLDLNSPGTEGVKQLRGLHVEEHSVFLFISRSDRYT